MVAVMEDKDVVAVVEDKDVAAAAEEDNDGCGVGGQRCGGCGRQG